MYTIRREKKKGTARRGGEILEAMKKVKTQTERRESEATTIIAGGKIEPYRVLPYSSLHPCASPPPPPSSPTDAPPPPPLPLLPLPLAPYWYACIVNGDTTGCSSGDDAVAIDADDDAADDDDNDDDNTAE